MRGAEVEEARGPRAVVVPAAAAAAAQESEEEDATDDGTAENDGDFDLSDAPDVLEVREGRGNGGCGAGYP